MASPGQVANDTDKLQGFTKEGIADFNAKIHALVDDGKLANVVTLIARHGEIVNCDAYGVHNIEATPPVPVKPDSIFRIASMTKPITSTAMMMLWEEDKWTLDDPVYKFIPEFKDLQVLQENGELVPQETSMTMKQLMSHSAGFGETLKYLDTRQGDLQDMIDALAKRPLFFQPGKEWRYGPSVDIQGYIIEKLTGETLDEFLERRIFSPLGMVDSGYVLPTSKADRIVSNHKYDSNGRLIVTSLAGSYNASRPKFIGGGGGLMLSTIKDYWRFAQMILNGGEFNGVRYLKASTVQMMHTNALEPEAKFKLYNIELKGVEFGLGFAIVQDPKAARTSRGIQSFFWIGLYGTWFWIDPIKDIIVIGMINNVNGALPSGAPAVRELSAVLVYKAMAE
jgi:CubicO group peptidase (beta-lactamase class C family)